MWQIPYDCSSSGIRLSSFLAITDQLYTRSHGFGSIDVSKQEVGLDSLLLVRLLQLQSPSALPIIQANIFPKADHSGQSVLSPFVDFLFPVKISGSLGG
ncbi:unnamed protein product, partial [Dicrocoelium dendriticum]